MRLSPGYLAWHAQKVKDVVYPPKNASKLLVKLEPQDVLQENELVRKKLEKEMAKMKRR